MADIPEGGIYRYYPDTLAGARSSTPPRSAAGRSRSWPRSSSTTPTREGVLLANGARFGGHTLFVKDRKLWYVNNFLGIPPEQQLVSPGRAHARARTCSAWSSRRRATASTARPLGTATLYVDDLAVAKSEWKTQPGHFALCGEGLTVGRDGSDPVSKEYGSPFAFTGGRIRVVEINIGDDAYIDLERDFQAGLARD